MGECPSASLLQNSKFFSGFGLNLAMQGQIGVKWQAPYNFLGPPFLFPERSIDHFEQLRWQRHLEEEARNGRSTYPLIFPAAAFANEAVDDSFRRPALGCFRSARCHYRGSGTPTKLAYQLYNLLFCFDIFFAQFLRVPSHCCAKFWTLWHFVTTRKRC